MIAFGASDAQTEKHFTFTAGKALDTSARLNSKRMNFR